jgi:hypothetical protein
VAWRQPSPDDPLLHTAWHKASDTQRAGHRHAEVVFAVAVAALTAIVVPQAWLLRVVLAVILTPLAYFVVVPVVSRVWFFCYAPAVQRDEARDIVRSERAEHAVELAAKDEALAEAQRDAGEARLRYAAFAAVERSSNVRLHLEELLKNENQDAPIPGQYVWQSSLDWIAGLGAILHDLGRDDLFGLIDVSRDPSTTPRQLIAAINASERTLQQWGRWNEPIPPKAAM